MKHQLFQNSIAPENLPPVPGDSINAHNFSESVLHAFSLVVLGVGPNANQLGSPQHEPGTVGYVESLRIAVKFPRQGSIAKGSIGWLPKELPPGERGIVQYRGIVPCVVAGAMTAGDLVSICTSEGRIGRGQVATSGEEAIGQILTSSVDGEIAPLRLFGCVVPLP